MIYRTETNDGWYFWSDEKHDVMVHSKSGHLGGCPRVAGDNRLALLEMRRPNVWNICDLDGQSYPTESHGAAYDGGSNSQCVNWAGAGFYRAVAAGVELPDGQPINLDREHYGQWRSDFHQSVSQSEWHVWAPYGQTRIIANDVSSWNFHFRTGHKQFHELAREDNRYYCRIEGERPWFTCNLDGSHWRVWRDGISHPAWLGNAAIYSYQGQTVYDIGGVEYFRNDEDGNHYMLVPGYAIFSKWDSTRKKNYAVKVLRLLTNTIVWSRDIDTYPTRFPKGDYDYYAMARPCLSWDAKYAIWHYRDNRGACCVQVARTGLSDESQPVDEVVRDMQQIREHTMKIDELSRKVMDQTRSIRLITHKYERKS